MESFQEYLSEKFPADGKRNTSGVIHGSIAVRIKEALKDPSTADKNFRFYVNKDHFQLLDLPNLGLSEVLVVPASGAAQVCCAWALIRNECATLTTYCHMLWYYMYIYNS